METNKIFRWTRSCSMAGSTGSKDSYSLTDQCVLLEIDLKNNRCNGSLESLRLSNLVSQARSKKKKGSG
jgi:hypothetical protein